MHETLQNVPAIQILASRPTSGLDHGPREDIHMRRSSLDTRFRPWFVSASVVLRACLSEIRNATSVNL